MPLRYALGLSFTVNFILGLLGVGIVLSILAFIVAYAWTSYRWERSAQVDKRT
jgi:hypothetical protein